MKVIFSILVHEKLDVVLNQIANFVKFNPKCVIIIHLSHSFRADLGKKIEKMSSLDHVIINNKSIRTGHCDNSQFYAHFSNLLFLKKNRIVFDYVCFHASNDMFVQYGLTDYLSNFEAGFGFFQARGTWYQGRHALKDQILLKALKKLDLDVESLRGSQVEGSFICYDVYKKVIALISKNRLHRNSRFRESIRTIRDFNKKKNLYFPGLPEGMFYAKEEVYFPTFSYLFSTKNCDPYVFINWENELRVTEADILRIIDAGNKDMTTAKFAVKRVERDMNDPIRKFINSLP
jgi:hypothetical protein